jgi:pimeloyl-ACP methyl ester carboxylesterase
MRSKLLALVVGALLLHGGASAQSARPSPIHAAFAVADESAAKYGSNPAVGKTFVHDGLQLYYEVYGSGEPLLLVHGNGGSIANFKAQIDFFRKHYKVIAMDSRDQGRSADSSDKITYEKMTDDLAALLDHLHSGPVFVLGWNDGGIEALLLGIRHPEKVSKIAAMAANLYPGGLAPEVLTWIESTKKEALTKPDEKSSRREAKLMQMMLDEPHIDPKALEAITVPTLVLASDHDAIRDEHTLEIYHHLANGELCIFPHATHMIPYDDPAVFNATVDRFFRTPFVAQDRMKDLLKSYGEMLAAQE